MNTSELKIKIQIAAGIMRMKRQGLKPKKISFSADYFLILGKPKRLCGMNSEFKHELSAGTFLIE